MTVDDPVVAPVGLIYSTSPRRAEGENRRSYFIKGGDKETVFAELAGCVLASAVGLPVPAVALCEFEAQLFAGSEDLRGVRDVSFWLERREKIENLPDLLSAVVVDTWLANRDRNWHNLIGESSGSDKVRLYFIDFEKSVTLRPFPLMSLAGVEPVDLWPSGELGTLVRSWGYLHPPQDIIRKISEFNVQHCRAILAPLAEMVGIDWLESASEALSRRAAHIQGLVEAVWNSR